MIYLDYNATTPVAEDVVEAMQPFYREHFGNPSSRHIYGRSARQAVEWARGKVASLIGAASSEIVFTSGGTESNNLAIRGTARSSEHGELVTSAIEHPSVSNPSRWLGESGWEVLELGVDADGRVELDAARGAIGSETRLVSVMHANNETGVIQPISEIAALARSAGAIAHTDASQTVGKLPVDVDDLGVDLLSIAGHKMYAPKGVGALFVREGTEIEPVLAGAGQEDGLRPGTENVASVLGLGKACELAAQQLDERVEHMRNMRERLWKRLHARLDGMVRHGSPEQCLPNTLNVSFPGVRGEMLLDACGNDIAASTGSACHENSDEPSDVLLAMGVEPEVAMGSIRLSVGVDTTPEEVAEAADTLVHAHSDVSS